MSDHIDYGDYCDIRVIPEGDPYYLLVKTSPTKAALMLHEENAKLKQRDELCEDLYQQEEHSAKLKADLDSLKISIDSLWNDLNAVNEEKAAMLTIMQRACQQADASDGMDMIDEFLKGKA